MINYKEIINNNLKNVISAFPDCVICITIQKKQVSPIWTRGQEKKYLVQWEI